MMKIVLGVVLLGWVQWAALAGSPAFKKVDRSLAYCTDVGVLRMTWSGASVVGSYEIRVVEKPIPGIVVGHWHDGLFVGRWHDPEGGGRIELAFTPDLKSFSGVFDVDSDRADWKGSWSGKLSDAGTHGFPNCARENQK